jgi:hypothetical protein
MSRVVESPQERIQRLVAEGRIPHELVLEAERFWTRRLRTGVRMPNGERVAVTRDDLHHAIVDQRILRRPDRIELALRSVFEIREADAGRRLGFSRWTEEEGDRLAALIIDVDGGLRGIHLVDERRMRRYRRRPGSVLWRR